MMKEAKRRSAKRAAAWIAAITLVGTLAAPNLSGLSTGAASATGDLNGDGAITGADVKILQDALISGASLTGDQVTNADVCPDGALNGLDLARLRQMAMESATPQSEMILIHLSDSGITVEGDDAGVTAISSDGKTVTISASGSYTVDGSITDGQILVSVPDIVADANSVDLYLQDVTMTSTTGNPCIYATSADKVKLTCTGTNTFTDTATAANATISGVIAAECDLTVTKNSTGTLDITSSMNRGIFTKDDLKLNGGTINVVTDVDDLSDADAIRANNTLEIDGATVNIESSADGLKSNKEDVLITSGTVNIKAGNDAIQAVTAITISGGDVVACGDRGLTLEAAGALAITGGNVLATATDYAFGSNVTVDTSASTQAIVQLDYAAEWKKGNAITLQQGGSTVYEMTPIKKFTYVLASGSSLNSSATYQLYTGGTQMTHDGSTTGDFAMTANLSHFTGVTELSGGGTVTPGTDTVTTDTATSLVYSDAGVTAYNASGAAIESPTNVTLSGTTATVILPSEISVSGTCSEGQLAVNVDKTTYADGLVTLNLEGLTLSSSTVAPIYVEAIGDEVALVSKSGYTNTISDGTSHTDTYVDSDGVTNTVNGAIFSRDDLKLKGSGTLVVNGNTEDGIVCKNDLKLWNGTITVNAQDDGIRGNDSVCIGDTTDSTNYGTLNVTVNTNNGTYGGDGIKANSTETDKGYITISGGTVTVNAYSDGIQAEQTFTMTGGTLDITTYTGAGTVSNNTGNQFPSWGGGMGDTGNENISDVSAKGIKAVGLYDSTGTTYQSGGNLNISGGTITMNTTDDCLHCGGDMTVTGGIMSLATGDDALHSDNKLTIGTAGAGTYDNVQIYVSQCYEGVEGVYIYQNSGTVYIVSTDDGYNAAGGADSSGTTGGGNWGQGGMSETYGEMHLSGGLVVCNSASGDHDAFDSNGNIEITGGYYCANGQEPMDCGDGGYSITNSGGNVITMTGGNTSLTTRYTFLDASGNAIVSFMSASGGSLTYSSGSGSAQSGGTISGGTEILTGTSYPVTIGGTLSGGTALSAGGGSTTGPGGNTGPGGWGF